MIGIGSSDLPCHPACQSIAPVKEKLHINVLNFNHVDGSKSTLTVHSVCNCGGAMKRIIKESEEAGEVRFTLWLRIQVGGAVS